MSEIRDSATGFTFNGSDYDDDEDEDDNEDGDICERVLCRGRGGCRVLKLKIVQLVESEKFSA